MLNEFSAVTPGSTLGGTISIGSGQTGNKIGIQCNLFWPSGNSGSPGTQLMQEGLMQRSDDGRYVSFMCYQGSVFQTTGSCKYHCAHQRMYVLSLCVTVTRDTVESDTPTHRLSVLQCRHLPSSASPRMVPLRTRVTPLDLARATAGTLRLVRSSRQMPCSAATVTTAPHHRAGG